MMIKLIAFDLDGTLLDSDHKTISERNIIAVRKAAEKGIKIVIISGRAYCYIKDIIKKLAAVDYAVCSNGAASMSTDGSIISSDCMNYAAWKPVYEILESEGLPAEIYSNGKAYLKYDDVNHFKNAAVGDELIEELKKDMIFCGSPLEELKDKPAEKLNSIYVPDEKYDSVRNKFINMGLYVTSSVPSNMEISKKGVNKGEGLKNLCSVLGIEPDETAVFGDGNNDIEMLEWSGNSYAMKNSEENVKKHAKFTADYNYNDGVAKEIEKFIT